MRRSTSAALLLVAGVTLGCRSDPKSAPAGEGRTEPEGAAPAEQGMCKEHGVLEAICTKCNPKLIPVFQAKGDWCTEHGFPESVCPICHPERGGRPTADVSADGARGAAGSPGGAPDVSGAPADGTKVRFRKHKTARLAGIETVKAAARAGGAGIVAPAKLSFDATKLAHINARAPGVVRAVKVEIGSRVKKGDTLAVIDSPEVGAERSRLPAARSRVEIAKESYAREKAMQEEGISSRKSLLAAQQDLDAAKAELAALGASLSVHVGRDSAFAGPGGYTLAAPLTGVVTERGVTVGKLVDSEEVLFEVVDTSSMWADIDVAELDLPAVALDQRVTLALDGLEGRELTGTIVYIAPAIDPHTRTARARVPLANPDGLLRANMYGQARIRVDAARAAVMVPRAAVQRAKGAHLVFVRLADDEYEARRVELGARELDFIEIRKGVKAGEEVVTQGSFLLKTETLKESIGAGCCDGD